MKFDFTTLGIKDLTEKYMSTTDYIDYVTRDLLTDKLPCTAKQPYFKLSMYVKCYLCKGTGLAYISCSMLDRYTL